MTKILKRIQDASDNEKGEAGILHFVSSRAKVRGFFEGENVVLGASVIGVGSLIGRNVLIGYPVRKSLQSFPYSSDFDIEKLDKISKGAKIGESCILRSGTLVYENVSIYDSVETGHNVLIREGSVVGNKTRIGSSAQLDGSVKVGRNVSIQSNVYLPHLTVIEDDVFLAPNAVLTNDPYPPSERRLGIVVGKGAVVGANSCIVARVRIGNGAVVGAGAVVTKDVPPLKVVMGAPAKVCGTREDFDKKRTRWEKRGK